jgi:hypothetical protein
MSHQVLVPYQLLSLIEQAKNHCFASHRTTHASLSSAPTDLLRSFAIEGSLLERRSRSGQQVRRSIRLVPGGEFCPMTAPLTPLLIWHPKGGLPASRTCAHYRMAPPIKQENLPAMEDCRLLLKNAVEIKLKGLFIISRRDGAH